MADKSTPAAPTGPAKAPNKMEAVRLALTALGNDAKPGDIVDYVQKTFNITMTKDHVSANKGKITAQSGGKKKGKRRGKRKAKAKAVRAAAPAAAPPAATAARRAAEDTSGIALDDIETIKTVLGRVAAADLKKLIDVMAR
jgi:hypothetical protein